MWETNLGSWLFIACMMPGENSCSTFMPASLPIVAPKSLKGWESDRFQAGRAAECATAEASTRKKYDVFSRGSPELSRRIAMLDAACVARPKRLSLSAK
jgi:hypothetical protein